MARDRLGGQLQTASSFASNGKWHWVDDRQRIRNLIADRGKNPNRAGFSCTASTGSCRNGFMDLSNVADHWLSNSKVLRIKREDCREQI